jgi:hypothetical protein
VIRWSGEYDRVLTVVRFPDLPDPDTTYLRVQREEREERMARDESGQRGDWRSGLRRYGWDEDDD